MNRRLLGGGILLLLFLSPYLLLFTELGLSAEALLQGSFSWGDFWWALKNSVIQSGFSALGAMFLGVFIALGLNRVEQQMPNALPFLQMILLAPILLPPFFVILTFLSWMNPFPFGLTGIVLIHIFVLAGLTALLLRSLINEKVGELSEVAEVLGAGRLQFFRAVWPLVRREFLSVFLFLFVWSFTSFSIPFVVGGGRGTTLEVLIFERVRISGDLSGAVMLSVFQTLLIALLLYMQSRVEGVRRSRLVAGRLLQSRLGLGVAVAVAISFVLPWLLLSWSGFSFIFTTPGFLGSATFALLQSIKFAVLVSLSVLALLSVIVYLLEINWVAKFFQVYFPASMALVGLAGLSLAPYFDLRILYVVGLVLLFVPSLIKLGLDASYFALREQVEVARSLGAHSWQIFMEILMPQLWPRICLLAGLSFVWTLGDFALARFFFESGETLPLLIENLMSSYRIDPALSLGQFVLVAGAAGFFVFWRLGRVFDP